MTHPVADRYTGGRTISVIVHGAKELSNEDTKAYVSLQLDSKILNSSSVSKDTNGLWIWREQFEFVFPLRKDHASLTFKVCAPASLLSFYAPPSLGEHELLIDLRILKNEKADDRWLKLDDGKGSLLINISILEPQEDRFKANRQRVAGMLQMYSSILRGSGVVITPSPAPEEPVGALQVLPSDARAQISDIESQMRYSYEHTAIAKGTRISNPEVPVPSSLKAMTELDNDYEESGPNPVVVAAVRPSESRPTLTVSLDADMRHSSSPMPPIRPSNSPSRPSLSGTSISPTSRPRYDKSKYYINDKFQTIVGLLHSFTPETKHEEKIEVNTKLIRLSQDFMEMASRYGKIIISEVQLDDNQKTIKTANLEGIIGGDKYIVGGILFKFAKINKKMQERGIFTDDRYAAKVAGLDMQGLLSYYNSDVRDLHVPMMLLIDYKGYRLIASTLLPIDESTLVYGSMDAGRTVHNSDAQMDKLFYEAATVLKLKGHHAGDAKIWLNSAVDMEGHLGHDGKYYALDFSRAMPPDLCTLFPQINGSRLFRRFRPELLHNFDRPLSPDGWSRFTEKNGESNHNDQDLVQATNHLTQTVIPRFAKEYIAIMRRSEKPDLADLTFSMHRRGINMRYLGILASLFKSHEHECTIAYSCKVICMIEMVARIFKVELRAQMRTRMKTIQSREWPLKIVVLNFLNKMFVNCDESTSFWSDELPKLMREKFTDAADPRTLFDVPEGPLEAGRLKMLYTDFQYPNFPNGRTELLLRIECIAGISFSSTINLNDPALLESSSSLIFREWDLQSLQEVVKHMSIVDHSQGYNYKLIAATDQKRQVELLTLAEKRFKSALRSNPNSKYTLRNLAQVANKRYKCHNPPRPGELPWPPMLDDMSRLADRYFVDALESDPKDPLTHIQYGKFCLEHCQYIKATEHFFIAAEHDLLSTPLNFLKEALRGQRDSESVRAVEELEVVIQQDTKKGITSPNLRKTVSR